MYTQHENVRLGQGRGQEVLEAPAPGPSPSGQEEVRRKVFPKHSELIAWKRSQEPAKRSPMPSK